jgi:hypothetical protein
MCSTRSRMTVSLSDMSPVPKLCLSDGYPHRSTYMQLVSRYILSSCLLAPFAAGCMTLGKEATYGTRNSPRAG